MGAGPCAERERERERESPLLEGGESERESDVYIIITTQTGEIEHDRSVWGHVYVNFMYGSYFKDITP
jgi:hypothetical protein